MDSSSGGHLSAEDIHRMAYLIKYLIKSSIKSRKGTGKQRNIHAIRFEYYINASETPLSYKTQVKIRPPTKHAINEIKIGPLMSKNSESSNEIEHEEIKYGD